MDGRDVRSAATRLLRNPAVAVSLGVVLILASFAIESSAQHTVSFEYFFIIATVIVSWSIPSWVAYVPFGTGAALIHIASGHYRVFQGGGDLNVLVWNIPLHIAMFLFTGFVIARLRQSYDYEQHHAAVDSLTGVTSRWSFLERLEHEAQRSHRYGHPHSLAFIDLDRFKEVNNRYGHRRGDAVLAAVGVAMRAVVRKTDILGRLGGDEFAVLLPETGPEARIAAEKLRDAVLDVARAEGLGDVLGVSIGLVTCTCKGPAYAQKLLAHADDLMFRSKVHGGNEIVHEIVSGTTPGEEGR